MRAASYRWAVHLWQWALIFLAGTAFLVRAGITLAAAGDEIATRTRLGGVFVGTLLMAGATSLPEIVTTASAALADAPDLAIGGLFGSGMANMAILAVIDLMRRRHVWTSLALGHVRVGAIALALTGLGLIGLATPGALRLGWVGVDTILVAGGYVAAIAWFRRSPGREWGDAAAPFPIIPTGVGEAEHPRGDLRSAVVRFCLAAGAILLAGPLVAIAGDGIAQATGMGETFFGVFFLAVVTSLPELVGSVGAVRIGAYDLAVGNLFGSNAFNMVLLLVADLAFRSGPILSAVSPSQIVGAGVAIMLMALALAAIVHGEETRIARLEPDAFLLLVAYSGGLLAVWLASR
jgi:cation:H+ antiporter